MSAPVTPACSRVTVDRGPGAGVVTVAGHETLSANEALGLAYDIRHEASWSLCPDSAGRRFRWVLRGLVRDLAVHLWTNGVMVVVERYATKTRAARAAWRSS